MMTSDAKMQPATGPETALGGEMAFGEIARKEGISKSGAFMAYRSGMRKLRSLGVDIERMRAMAAELERNRSHEHGMRWG